MFIKWYFYCLFISEYLFNYLYFMFYLFINIIIVNIRFIVQCNE